MSHTNQPKRLGVGASCTVRLRFLHPKNKVKDIIQNQTVTQQLNGLIVQSREVKSIRREDKECIIFRHKDFGGQLLWTLERGVVVDIEGPAETFFNQPPPADAAAPPAAAGATDQAQQQQQQQGGGGNDKGEEGAEELPLVIQEILARGGNYLDADDYMVAGTAAPMVDEDNEPAPENVPVAAKQSNDIFSGWEHSGICHHRCMIQQNPKCVLKFWTARDGEPSNLQLFEGLFFMPFIKSVIIPTTNNNLLAGEKNVTYGEFLWWIGLWLLMSTLIGPQRCDFWAAHTIDAFPGAPIHLGVWMSHKRFEAILQALTYTDRQPPTFIDKFGEVRQMLEAWGKNMQQNFTPAYVNCLDESMSVWTNKFMCPGFMFVPRKPWPFRNEYHSMCCCTSGIMWGIEMVEGKDHPQQLGHPQHDNLGSTVGLLLRILTPIFFKGFIVILDSGFCILKGIIELRKKGVFASALIKKRGYWPRFVHGDEIKDHFSNKQVGDTDSWAGQMDDIPFHVYAMKEPDYVMSLMSSYGTNDRLNGKETRRDWKEGSANMSTRFKYPEVIHNHFQYRHAVDDHNAKRHSPISIEVVWATKHWPNRVFCFLLSITEVNCFLAETYVTGQKI